MRLGTMRPGLSAIFVLTTIFTVVPARALQNTPPPDCKPGRDLITIPEIKSQNGKLQGVIILSDEQRALAGSATGTPCNWQHIRFFKGFSALQPNKTWPSTGDIIPGPTLRARVGDLVEITFLNQVDQANFPKTLDQGEQGKTPGCDIATATQKNGGASVQVYPRQSGPPWTTPPWGGSPGDTYPNCLHGSSTVNLHFHGTHTTPSTTGDKCVALHPSGATRYRKDRTHGWFRQSAIRDFFQMVRRERFASEMDATPWRLARQAERASYPLRPNGPLWGT